MNAIHDYLAIQPKVAAALQERRPVVVLESTILAHGMPFPQNLDCARRVEAIVREGGAVPAAVAVLDGRIRVGLDDADLERLATSRDIVKLSRRDLAPALALRTDGATTVSATMIAASLAEIPIFVTGGLGGVHRGAETSFDVSADLDELAATDVAVVCAGSKSVLDLPKTLEYLETRGVPVLGFGTSELPAFYTRSSGLPVPWRVDDAETAARILRTKWQLGLDGGVVIAVPIPAEAALDPAVIDGAIDTALAEAAAQGIAGKAVTPFLLSRLTQITGGASLAANVALVENNARIGAAIAVAYAALRTPQRPIPRQRQRPFL